MNARLAALIEKKKYWGFLAGQDALDFVKLLRVSSDDASEWTARDAEQLTRWQLGLPTLTQFQITAGPPNATAPTLRLKPVGLCGRKYPTLGDRLAARRAKDRERKAGPRLPMAA